MLREQRPYDSRISSGHLCRLQYLRTRSGTRKSLVKRTAAKTRASSRGTTGRLNTQPCRTLQEQKGKGTSFLLGGGGGSKPTGGGGALRAFFGGGGGGGWDGCLSPISRGEGITFFGRGGGGGDTGGGAAKHTSPFQPGPPGLGTLKVHMHSLSMSSLPWQPA